MQKDTKTAIAFSGILIGLLVAFAALRGVNAPSTSSTVAVSIENGTQIIDLSAKGGFSPAYIEAAAGLPTELRVSTNGTYDCSSTIVIPSLSYAKTLPPTGVEKIQLDASQAQGVLDGTCGMGMYSFKIAFK